jgi:hypothetical protein
LVSRGDAESLFRGTRADERSGASSMSPTIWPASPSATPRWPVLHQPGALSDSRAGAGQLRQIRREPSGGRGYHHRGGPICRSNSGGMQRRGAGAFTDADGRSCRRRRPC